MSKPQASPSAAREKSSASHFWLSQLTHCSQNIPASICKSLTMSALLSKISSLQGYCREVVVGWGDHFKESPDTFYTTEVGRDSGE